MAVSQASCNEQTSGDVVMQDKRRKVFQRAKAYGRGQRNAHNGTGARADGAEEHTVDRDQLLARCF